ncbi:MFS transporter [Aneurinibacillus tyrosinisolvens]|uniref:MFS transporter n=1 Tax=Aneurinibacillus tyrosinisolvens TaxID=1443435 RepID=UPI0022A919AF|nr:MFS transporter [Aneurinibacillus tyrosinisolvens]
MTGRVLLFNRGFWFLIIPFFVCGFTTTGLMDTHLIPFAQHCGFSVSTTSAAVSLLAVFNTAGTLVAGILADRWNNSRLLAIIYLVRAFTLAFLVIMTSNHGLMSIFLEHSWLLVLFSISFGLVDFSVVAPTLKLLSSYFPTGAIGMVTGLLYMSHQLGSALGSYLPGILFDKTNSYQISFEISFILLIIASIVSVCFPKIQEYKQLSRVS